MHPYLIKTHPSSHEPFGFGPPPKNLLLEESKGKKKQKQNKSLTSWKEKKTRNIY
jgi:hypothetical protein